MSTNKSGKKVTKVQSKAAANKLAQQQQNSVMSQWLEISYHCQLRHWDDEDWDDEAEEALEEANEPPKDE